MKTKNKKRLSALSAVTIAALMTASFGSTAVFADRYVAPEPTFGNYFTADFDSKDDAMANATAVNEMICEEGFTLLKNEGNALPIGKKGAKISIFGKSSANMFFGFRVTTCTFADT